MNARVTMRDVAKIAGVSPMTVSRALKSDSSVNEKTRKLVRDTASQLGYVYDSTAQAFRSQRSGFIALTLPSINNANFAATHKAMTSALEDTDLQLLLGITNYDVHQEERMIKQLLARRPDAVILTGGTHTDDTRKLLETVSVPIFEMWDVPSAPLGHVVGFSNHDAMEHIVAHLAEIGCRRLGFVGANADSDFRGHDRRLGTIAAAQKFGLDPVVVFDTGPAPATMTNGFEVVGQQIEGGKQLDALGCVSDPVAFGAMMALRAHGLDAPDDIAVTGFGNFEVARICQPSITTLDVGAAHIGATVANLARQILFDEHDAQTPVLEKTQANLLVGRSSRA